jgi:hypothetical protein
MANPNKVKGDRAEREALVFLQKHVPDLLCERPQRRLGLGRSFDTGDLDAFDDVVVQVKNYASLATGLRNAAEGAEVQAKRAGVPFGVGMTMLPRLPITDLYRWVFVATQWPTVQVECDAVVRDAQDLLTVLRATQEHNMLVRLERGSNRPLYASWLPRWADDYQRARVLA